MNPTQSVAIIGSGPAGLMAASRVASKGIPVHVYEKRSGLGRKILIAGSSGLNVAYDCTPEELLGNYTGPKSFWKQVLSSFSARDWIDSIESLGVETFLGTSRRYFVKGMKGSTFLQAWIEYLKSQGVLFFPNQECLGFELNEKGEISLRFHEGTKSYSSVCFCLGGGSWEKTEKPLRWPQIFISKKMRFNEFYSANSGFQVEWTDAFLKEAEGLPLKNIVFSNRKGSRAGELVITRYGLEGTPIYALGETGQAWVDLKPDLTESEILKQLSRSKDNLSPIRRMKKLLKLPPAALALLFHFSDKKELAQMDLLVKRLKKFPLTLKDPQPLEEAISSGGGLDWCEISQTSPLLMLKSFPGVFVAGEMIDWIAPTGGFLIQGCVSLGNAAGQGILEYLDNNRTEGEQ